mmetsp:Transcript_7806/g.25625  ORF Transcript_7806/g.25625 Transcript_7806/m.25625 type:complete len:299 (-) Transcript_7806:146-1042(-)
MSLDREERRRETRTTLGTLVACGLLMVAVVCVMTRVGASQDWWSDDDEMTLRRRRACRKARVLVTGFRQFNDVANPSESAAKSLNGTCGRRYCVEAEILAVNDRGSGWAAERIHDYAAVLHLGLEDSAKGLKIEVAAKNLKGSRSNLSSFDIPCRPRGGSSSSSPSPEPAVRGAPCLQVTTAPLDRMLLEPPPAYSLEEIWSRDPGAFFCNECYFRTLNAVRSQKVTIPASYPDCLHVAAVHENENALVPVLFVHLPDPALLSFDALVLPLLRQILDVLGDPPLVRARAADDAPVDMG